MTKTRDFAEYLNRRIDASRKLAKLVEQADSELDIAEQIHQAREEAGLTQMQLAELIGTSQSVVARIEDPDYEGHSLTTLRKVAEALDLRFRIEFYKRPQFIMSEVVTTTLFTMSPWPSCDDPSQESSEGQVELIGG